MSKRDDGKTAVSFRIPQELEKAFHKYCANREDRITKSELFTKVIYDHLQQVGVSVEEASEKPIADASMFE